VSQAGEAQRVWHFLVQIETALVPLGFSSLRIGLPMQEVDAMLVLLDSARVKMSQLEDVIGSRLEGEGCILAEAVAEHVVMCFRSREPKVSLEPIVQGHAEDVEEAAQVGVRDTTRLVAERFEHQVEDT
jgi:hypothetical protein